MTGCLTVSQKSLNETKNDLSQLEYEYSSDEKIPENFDFLNSDNPLYGVRSLQPVTWEKISHYDDMDFSFVEPEKNTNNIYRAKISFQYSSLSKIEGFENFKNTQDLANYFLEYFDQLNANTKQGSTYLAKMPAETINYKYQDKEGQSIQGFLIWLIKDNKYYAVSASCLEKDFTKNIPIFEKVTNSFEIL